MLSQYFKRKTSIQEFKQKVEDLILNLQNKKVLIYGAGEAFLELNKQYDFINKLNIVAIADIKFLKGENIELDKNIKTITPQQIAEENYDIILISNEKPQPIIRYIQNDLNIQDKELRTIFCEDIKDEIDNINYLYKYKFDKTLPKLIKKIKNKKVVIYGAGIFFETIKRYFDISKLNIVAIADRRFNDSNDEYFLSYKAISPNKITDYNPDYVLVATKFYVNIIENLYYDTLKDTKIKVKPFVHKNFITLLKEIWR